MARQKNRLWQMHGGGHRAKIVARTPGAAVCRFRRMFKLQFRADPHTRGWWESVSCELIR
jgi:hypothetical protein